MFKPDKLEYIPQGYSVFVTNAGIKDQSLDLGVVFSEKPAKAAAMFTRNKVQGNPVIIGRKHVKNGKIQAVIVNSKNSNVATGKEGYENSMKVCQFAAEQLQIKTGRVFPSSTGVIGRPLPVDKITSALQNLPDKLKSNHSFIDFARAIMTTDTFPKFVCRKVGNSVIVGVAKGSGMIEPNMATMLAYFFTDADIPVARLRKILKKTTALTFNSLSVDTDTSTSDTVLAMANGMAGKVKKKEFSRAFYEAALDLTYMLAQDGEGATKLFKVSVKNAKTKKAAYKIAKSIVNSPLVKTAIYQGDPNWGRLFMAIGKTPGVKVKPEKIRLFWGGKEYSNAELNLLTEYLRSHEVLELTVDMGIGKKAWTVYGCDYTEEYVKINAYYTT